MACPVSEVPNGLPTPTVASLLDRVLLWAITGLIGWTLWSTVQNSEKLAEVGTRQADILIRLHDTEQDLHAVEQDLKTDDVLFRHCLEILRPGRGDAKE